MDWTKFFSMGGYAFYVWGSYLTALILMGGEVLVLMRRRSNLEKERNARSAAEKSYK